MQLDLPMTIDNLITIAGFAGAVIYQSAVLRNSLKQLAERIEKLDLEVAKITDILIKQEGQSVRLDSVTTRIDRHLKWHDENPMPLRRTAKKENSS